MSNSNDTIYPTPTTPIQTIGLREICQVNNHHFRRLRGTETWIECIPPTPAPTTPEADKPDPDINAPIYLSLVQETQSPSEPNHWSLFVARENHPGQLYQVKGDAEHMTYEPSVEDVDITTAEDFLTLYQLAVVTEDEAQVVKEVADKEIPPGALNRAAVRENCQGWCVRVLGKLVERGIVEGEVEMVRGLMQPV